MSGGARYIGVMSGTSMDGIDAVLVDWDRGETVVIAHHYRPYSRELRAALLELVSTTRTTLSEFGRLDVEVGEAFAATVRELLAKSGETSAAITAVGSHGQTVFHQPDGKTPFTLQIGDPNVIAERSGITTVADLRRRDVAAGGQGAPLVPAFHAARFRTSEKNRVVLNLGGIANVTILPADSSAPVSGFDTGPANVLLDSWAEATLGQPMDHDGRWAASGSISEPLLEAMLGDPYFERPSPKSTGREYFNLAWLRQFPLASMAPEDIQATLVELTARSVAVAIAQAGFAADEVLVCGGGAFNPQTMAALRRVLTPATVTTTADFGLAPQWVEAAAFAWLARQTLSGGAGNLCSVTGARHPVVLGGIYPGKPSPPG